MVINHWSLSSTQTSPDSTQALRSILSAEDQAKNNYKQMSKKTVTKTYHNKQK